MTILRVLGSATGGGFPQWNCNCRNCDGVRRGTMHATPHTQSSIALDDSQHNWLVMNASPGILAQLRNPPALQPAHTPRDTGIVGVVLMDAQIGHVTGLLMLHEHRQVLPVYASTAIISDLSTTFPLTRMLSHYCDPSTRALTLDGTTFSVPPLDDMALTAAPLENRAPSYSSSHNACRMGDNIGLRIVDRKNSRHAFYAPDLARVEPYVLSEMGVADVMLVDGTCWRNDEMLTLGFSTRTAADMGHLAQSDSSGMIDVFDQLPATCKVLIRINNANPILGGDSPQRRELETHGIEVACDDVEISL